MGWEIDELEGVPTDINPHGEKIECFMQGTRDYIKYIKRGYSRVAQINAFDVRANRLESDEAKNLSEKYDGRRPPSLEIFLEYMGLSEDEFNSIVKSMSIPPYDHQFYEERQCSKSLGF